MQKEGLNFGLLFNPWWSFCSVWLDPFSESESDGPMRRFIRHPSDIPIDFTLGKVASFSERLRDVSRGGLCFNSEKPIPEGSIIHIEIGPDQNLLEADGTVVWCRKEPDAYAVGVAFNDKTTHFNVRMVEQMCHIEHYRSEILETEGRDLTSEEAAKEWIEKYAAEFPT